MNTNIARLADTPLLDTLSDKLSKLQPLDDGNPEDTIWRFTVDGGRATCTLDFSIFELRHVQFQKEVLIKYDANDVSLSLRDFAKLIWLDMATGKKPTGMFYRGVFTILKGVFAFIVDRNIDYIKVTDLEDFYGFMLTQDVTEKGIQRRLSAPSYANRLGVIPLPILTRLFSRYSVNQVLESINDRQASKALNSICQNLMDMTFLEYVNGGSFNFLGLDVGKHYIDHCYNVFEKNFAYSAAIRHTIDTCLNNNDFHDYIGLNRSIFQPLLGKVLIGRSLEDIYKEKPTAYSKLEAIREYSHAVFRENYTYASNLINAFKIDTVNRIITKCKLPERFDTQEFVRSLLFVDVFHGHFKGQFAEHKKSKKAIWQEYASTCEGDDTLSIDLVTFERIATGVIDESAIKLPIGDENLRTYFQHALQTLPISIDEHRFTGIRFLNMWCNYSSYAGALCWVGMTGWRKSEFGFPLSAINIAVNAEPSDNHYTPWRFNVKWEVPKTSGKTPLDREVTLSCYILATQLAHLNNAGDDLPCLYPVDPQLKNVGRSEAPIKTAINSWWGDFVTNYTFFVDIDRHKFLSNKGKQASKSEDAELTALEARYQFSASHMTELTRMRERLQQELPLVLLAITNSSSNKLGSILKRYIAGELDIDNVHLLENNLSTETLDKLKNGEYELSTALVMFVRNELLGDSVYPSPHAFRHVWAEAVLTRYRGDVGKFIRANFKHLNERFFMAYVRNKAMQSIIHTATRQVINSVVRKQLNSVEDKYRGFAGGFDRYLVKAVSITHIYSQNEYEALATRIATEKVVTMKANPWSDCILRVGTEGIAKCSKNGVPQRQNAEPKLCLGCINGNISEGHFIGIVVYTKQDVEACRNPSLPYFIKEQHVEVVKNALKRVTELRDNSAPESKYEVFIDYLAETLEIVQKEGKRHE